MLNTEISWLSGPLWILTSLVFVVFLLNSPSWPFIWHIRFWWRAIPLFFHSLLDREAYLKKWERAKDLKGGLFTRIRLRRTAFFDDCDFNIHLSNSSYAKSADSANAAWVWEVMAPLMISGAKPALGASHYAFVKEVPMLGEYVMETRVAGWGAKWIYLVTEFVIYPKRKRVTSPMSSNPESPLLDADGNKTKYGGTATTNQSTLPDGTMAMRGDLTPTTTDPAAPGTETARAITSLRSPKERKDGGVVAAYAVHEACFKVGRITVPPRVALHFALHSPSPSERARVHEIAKNKKTAYSWLSGGWRSSKDADSIGKDIGPAEDTIRDILNGMENVSAGLGHLVSA